MACLTLKKHHIIILIMKYYLIDTKKMLNFHHAGKTKQDSQWKHYERTANEDILFLVTDGVLNMKVTDEDFSIHPGEILFIKAGDRHIGTEPAATSFYWIHFHSEDCKEIDETALCDLVNGTENDTRIILPQYCKINHMENHIILFNQLIYYYRDAPQNLINQYLASAILIEISNQFRSNMQNTPVGNRRFEEIVAYINATYRDEVSISDIADKFGYNAKYMARLFRKYLNMSPKDYLLALRLKVAELKLLDTTDTVATIAKNCGFSNEYYFMRLFKKKYGISPSTYRNAYSMQNITKY